jgi:ABC-type Mn2+/Zn2+ transport system ATPase subunit
MIDDPPVVDLLEVGVHYQAHRALHQLTATIARGERVGIVGPNGAGKTTLLRVLVGLVTPTRGSLRTFGQPPQRSRHRIAYLTQRHPVGRHHPVRVLDVVSMGRYVHRGPVGRLRHDDREAVAGALRRMELDDLAARRLSSLSGGQQRRTFLARTLAQEAELVLLDEPYASMDANTAQLIESQLTAAAAAGATVICVDHDLGALSRRYDRVLLVRESLRFDGNPFQALDAGRLRTAFGSGLVVLDDGAVEG